VHEAHVAALVGHERDRGRHAAADRVAGDRHPLGSSPFAAPSRRSTGRSRSPARSPRVAGLGRAVVLDERERGAGAAGQLAHEPVMRARVAEHPPAAVHVQDHRQRALDALGPHDADAHVADVGGHRDPALVDGQLLDRRGLDVVEHLAGLIGVSSYRNGGLAVASTNACEAGSSTTGTLVRVIDMVTPRDGGVHRLRTGQRRRP
jgi:hypothetical protein